MHLVNFSCWEEKTPSVMSTRSNASKPTLGEPWPELWMSISGLLPGSVWVVSDQFLLQQVPFLTSFSKKELNVVWSMLMVAMSMCIIRRHEIGNCRLLAPFSLYFIYRLSLFGMAFLEILAQGVGLDLGMEA